MGRNLWENVSPEMAETVVAARDVFRTYAAHDGPVDPDWPVLRQIQVELIRWQVRNFGCPSYTMQSSGITEETGEFSKAFEAMDLEGAIDAFGDTTVYACNYCSLLSLDFHTIVGGMTWPSRMGQLMEMHRRRAEQATGRIAHASLKHEQKIRGYTDLDRVRLVVGEGIEDLLATQAFRLWWMSPPGVGPVAAFLGVASKILKRDWIADAMTGGETS